MNTVVPDANTLVVPDANTVIVPDKNKHSGNSEVDFVMGDTGFSTDVDPDANSDDQFPLQSIK